MVQRTMKFQDVCLRPERAKAQYQNYQFAAFYGNPVKFLVMR